MWVACKKRRIEQYIFSRKRKQIFGLYEDEIQGCKRCKRTSVESNYKRKPEQFIENPIIKKQKMYDKFFCLLHNEKYVCDIYECNGLNEYCVVDHMPYIS